MKFFYTLLLVLGLSIGANSQIIYIKSGHSGSGNSWADARSDLKTAMDEASEGTQIWVAEGIYLPHSTDRNASFILKNGVEVYGGFPATGEPGLADRDPQLYPTVLSGDIGATTAENDNAFTVIQSINNSNSTLDGLTISDGNANRQGDNQPELQTSGGGLYIAATTPNQAFVTVVNNCIFENNHAGSGGAVFITGNNSSTASPIFESCIFRNNSGEFGGAIRNVATDTGSNNSFFANCTFSQNQGLETGGALDNLANNGTMGLIFNACLFSENNSPVGGAMFNFPNEGSLNAQATNCIFYANTAESGGALDNFAFGEDAINFTITNCTFTANVADVGAALSTFGGGVLLNINNSIFWDNQVANSGGATANNFAGGVTNFSFSLIQEGSCDENGFVANCGNMIFNQNPLFVNPVGLDFTLAPCSPALDMGTSSGVPLEDFNGNDRSFGNGIDLGAVEWSGLPTFVSLDGFTTNNISCNGANDGNALVNVSGGVTPYQFIWSHGIGNTQNPQNLASGTYQVTVQDAVGCQATSSFTITEPAAILVSPNVENHVFCFGGSSGIARVIVEGGIEPYTYQWSAGGESAVITDLPAGTHQVTVTDANGCEATSEVHINQPDEIVININVDQAITCFAEDNGALSANTAGGSGALNFNWSNGSVNTSLQNLSTGEYCLTVTDQNQCTAVECIILEGSEEIITSTAVLQNVDCAGNANGSAMVTAEGGNAPYTYLWDNGESTSTAVNLSAGNHIVTITDANNCNTVAEAVISEPETLIVDINVDMPNSCGENNGILSATPNGGAGGYTYDWDTNETTLSIAALSDGQYCVTVTDANGCTTSNCQTLEATEAVTGEVNLVQNLSCFEANDGSATAAAVTGLAPFSFVWDNGEMEATALELSASEHQVTVTDAANCTEVLSITVTQPDALEINVDVINHVSDLGASDGNISVSANGGTAPYTFEWDNGIGETQNPSNLEPGDYTLTLTDANGCSTSTTVTLININQIAITAIEVTNVSCNGGNDGAVVVIVEGGTAPYTYNWSHDIGMIENPQNLAAGTYSVTITDVMEQSVTETVEITEPTALILLDFSTTNLLCSGDSNGTISIEIDGGVPPYSYDWGDNIADSPALENLISGAYTLVVTDANGCTFSPAAIEITEPDAIALDQLVVENPSCNGDTDGSIDFEVVGGVPTYSFDWEDEISDDNSAEDLMPGTYSVTITDVNNCVFSSSFEITETPVLQASGGSTADSGSGDGVAWVDVIGGTPPYTLNWVDADMQTTDTVSNLIAGTYVVLITDANNCTLTATVEVDMMSNVDGITALESLDIFPNPTADLVQIQWVLEQSEMVEVSLWNSLGQRVEVFSSLEGRQQHLELDLSDYANGVYWLRMEVDGNWLSRKVVKQ